MKTRTQAPATRRRQAGYTIMDMMAVVAIIGILGSLGFNQYNKHVARAKRPETMLFFRAIATAQREQMLTQAKYAGTFDELGINIENGRKVSPTEIQGFTYNYRIFQDQGPKSWYVVATGNIDGDAFPDIIAASNPR